MENDKMQVLLTKVLEEQIELSRLQKDTISILKDLETAVESSGSMDKNFFIQEYSSKLESFQRLLANYTEEIKAFNENSQRVQVQNNIRIFLESDAKKWMVYLIVTITFLTYLYRYAVR